MNKYNYNPRLTRDRKKLAALKQVPEIRMRNVTGDTAKKLIGIGSFLKVKTVPDTLVKMIDRFMEDQDKIADVQARNTELHKKLARYVEREKEMIELIEVFIKYNAKFVKMTNEKARGILKKFRGTKRKAGAGGPARPGAKNVPRKKSGGKKLKQGRLL